MRDFDCHFEVLVPAHLEAELVLHLTEDQYLDLHGRLKALALEDAPGREIRVPLAPNQNGESWTLFFKLREEGTRLMVAHPEKKAWVALLGLLKSDFSRWLESVEQRKAVRIDNWVQLSFPSNFHLAIVPKKP